MHVHVVYIVHVLSYVHLRCNCLVRLDLDKWIYEPPSESEEDNKDDNLSFLLPSGSGAGGGTFGDVGNYTTADSPKGKKRRKKKSKLEQEEEEEMKKVSRVGM